jgi:hypothetical protein
MDDRKKEMIKHAEETSDQWEPEGQYGHDPSHMKIKKRSDLRSIRIDDEFLGEIRKAASDEGFDSYQAFIKVVLKKYLSSRKKKA